MVANTLERIRALNLGRVVPGLDSPESQEAQRDEMLYHQLATTLAQMRLTTRALDTTAKRMMRLDTAIEKARTGKDRALLLQLQAERRSLARIEDFKRGPAPKLTDRVFRRDRLDRSEMSELFDAVKSIAPDIKTVENKNYAQLGETVRGLRDLVGNKKLDEGVKREVLSGMSEFIRSSPNFANEQGIAGQFDRLRATPVNQRADPKLMEDIEVSLGRMVKEVSNLEDVKTTLDSGQKVSHTDAERIITLLEANSGFTREVADLKRVLGDTRSSAEKRDHMLANSISSIRDRVYDEKVLFTLNDLDRHMDSAIVNQQQLEASLQRNGLETHAREHPGGVSRGAGAAKGILGTVAGGLFQAAGLSNVDAALGLSHRLSEHVVNHGVSAGRKLFDRIRGKTGAAAPESAAREASATGGMFERVRSAATQAATSIPTREPSVAGRLFGRVRTTLTSGPEPVLRMPANEGESILGSRGQAFRERYDRLRAPRAAPSPPVQELTPQPRDPATGRFMARAAAAESGVAGAAAPVAEQAAKGASFFSRAWQGVRGLVPGAATAGGAVDAAGSAASGIAGAAEGAAGGIAGAAESAASGLGGLAKGALGGIGKVGGFLGKAAVPIQVGLGGLEFFGANNNHDRGAAVAGTAGGIVGGELGASGGAAGGAAIGSLIGGGIGALGAGVGAIPGAAAGAAIGGWVGGLGGGLGGAYLGNKAGRKLNDAIIPITDKEIRNRGTKVTAASNSIQAGRVVAIPDLVMAAASARPAAVATPVSAPVSGVQPDLSTTPASSAGNPVRLTDVAGTVGSISNNTPAVTPVAPTAVAPLPTPVVSAVTGTGDPVQATASATGMAVNIVVNVPGMGASDSSGPAVTQAAQVDQSKQSEADRARAAEAEDRAAGGGTTTHPDPMAKPDLNPLQSVLSGIQGMFSDLLNGAKNLFGGGGAAGGGSAGALPGSGRSDGPDVNIASGVGALSAKYESGGRGVGTISSGRGDAGGVSYGAHQLASKTGTMAAFLASPEGQPFASSFSGQSAGSDGFNQAYKGVVGSQGAAFNKAQDDYINRTHFQPVLKAARAAGLPVDNPAVQSALYSQSVQHGLKGNKEIIQGAVARLGGKTGDPDAVIDAVYDSRNAYTNALPGVVDQTSRYQRERADAHRESAQLKATGGLKPGAKGTVQPAPTTAKLMPAPGSPGSGNAPVSVGTANGSTADTQIPTAPNLVMPSTVDATPATYNVGRGSTAVMDRSTANVNPSAAPVNPLVMQGPPTPKSDTALPAPQYCIDDMQLSVFNSLIMNR